METVTIHTDFIKLQDLLKLTHQVSSGGEERLSFRRASLRQRRNVYHAR